MVCHDRTLQFLDIVSDLGQTPSWPTPAPLTLTEFGRTARSIHASILAMLQFLRSQANEYMDLDRFVTAHASKMSDHDRDVLEHEVSNFGKVCSKKIESLAATIGANGDTNKETLVHQRTVIIYLCNEIKQVGDELKSLKAFRYQRAPILQQPEKTTVLPVSLDTDTFEAESVPAADLVELQVENEQFVQRLSNNIEAIQAAEQGMREIGQMCEVFASKVLEQELQINSIYDNIVTGTVNIQGGVEELRKAEKGSVLPLQFYILLLASFSLSFLHWYSR